MKVRVGTSGYSYKEWKGVFYPEKLASAGYLRFYAERFPTVEINNTFYRMPNRALLERWAAETPESFRFVLKAPQRITHQKRLAADAETLGYFLETARALGPKLGPVLFQLPPYAKADVDRLRAFLALLPSEVPGAFEFRHPTWDEEPVPAALRQKNAALCLADTDPDEDVGAAAPPPAILSTADWGYLRLRRRTYAEADLASWAARIRAQPWREAYVFFKHEDSGTAPNFARRFMELLGPSPLPLSPSGRGEST